MTARRPWASPTQWMFLLFALFASTHVALLTELIPVTVLLPPLLGALLVHRRLARVDTGLLKLFVALAAIAAASYLLNRGNPLVSSASPVYLLYLNVAFVLKVAPPDAWRRANTANFWSGYRMFMIVTALLGIAQLGMGDSFFSFRDLIPEDFRVTGYNTTNAIAEGSSIFRANGFMFYEPSYFSQFLGVAILVEMWRWRNPLVLGLYVVALLASFSGTGLILLGIGLAVLAISQSSASWKTIALTIVPLPLLLFGAMAAFPDFFLARIGEFAQENSSAYIRFVSPALYVLDSYESSIAALFVGIGPGLAASVRDADVMADFPGIGKMLFEYGALGGIVITMLYSRFCARARMASWLKWPILLVQFLLNNGIYTPISLVFFLLLALFGDDAAIPQRAGAARRVRRRRPASAPVVAHDDAPSPPSSLPDTSGRMP